MALSAVAVLAIAAGVVAAPAWAAPQSPAPAETPEKATPRPVPKPMGAAAMASPTPPEEKTGQEPSEAPAAEASTPPPAPSRPSMSPPRPRGKVALPTKVDPKTGQSVVSITNLDLERIYGSSVVPVSSATETPYAAAGGGFDASANLPLDAAPAAGETRAGDPARIAEIDAELKRLSRNELGIVNPLLPPPKLTDAEKAAMQGKDNRERLDLTKQRIHELEQEKARLASSPSGEKSPGR